VLATYDSAVTESDADYSYKDQMILSCDYLQIMGIGLGLS